MSDGKKITREDLENKFRGLQHQIVGKVDSKRNSLATAAVTVAVLVLLVTFLIGKRSGKRKSTIVEVRRY
jgi:hypothetical protein